MDITAHHTILDRIMALRVSSIYFSLNPNITENIIMEHFDKWHWPFLSANKSVSMTMILDHLDWPWDYDAMCSNPNVTLEFMLSKKSIDKLNWWRLSRRIDFREILHHPNFPWNYDDMSSNPTIHLDYVLNHPNHSWNDYKIAQNPFINDYIDVLQLLARRHMAAFQIQLYWRKCTTDHVYAICHKLQLRRVLS